MLNIIHFQSIKIILITGNQIVNHLKYFYRLRNHYSLIFPLAVTVGHCKSQKKSTKACHSLTPFIQKQYYSTRNGPITYLNKSDI